MSFWWRAMCEAPDPEEGDSDFETVANAPSGKTQGGRETLEDGGDWQYQTNSLHKFFKVEVEMP